MKEAGDALSGRALQAAGWSPTRQIDGWLGASEAE